MKRFKNILLVADGGTVADTVLDQAVFLAERNRARLSLVAVMEGTARARAHEHVGKKPRGPAPLSDSRSGSGALADVRRHEG